MENSEGIPQARLESLSTRAKKLEPLTSGVHPGDLRATAENSIRQAITKVERSLFHEGYEYTRGRNAELASALRQVSDSKNPLIGAAARSSIINEEIQQRRSHLDSPEGDKIEQGVNSLTQKQKAIEVLVSGIVNAKSKDDRRLPPTINMSNNISDLERRLIAVAKPKREATDTPQVSIDSDDKRILNLFRINASYEEIAGALQLDQRAANEKIALTFGKLGANTQPEALINANLMGLIKLPERPAQNLIDELTDRQQEIAYLLSLGLGNREILEFTQSTPGSLKSDVEVIFNTLGTNRNQIVGSLLNPDMVSLASAAESPNQVDILRLAFQNNNLIDILTLVANGHEFAEIARILNLQSEGSVGNTIEATKQVLNIDTIGLMKTFLKEIANPVEFGTAVREAEPPLTTRHQIYLSLEAQGYSQIQIAALLGVEFETIKSTIDTINERIGSKTKMNRCVWYWRSNPDNLQETEIEALGKTSDVIRDEKDSFPEGPKSIQRAQEIVQSIGSGIKLNEEDHNWMERQRIRLGLSEIEFITLTLSSLYRSGTLPAETSEVALTSDEQSILTSLFAGKTTREIAEEQGVSYVAFRKRLSRGLYAKLGVNSSEGAVVRYLLQNPDLFSESAFRD